MPKQKDLKRLVRERMSKTGESYTTARAHVVRKTKRSPVEGSPSPRACPSPRDLVAIAGMSDDAVKAKTGKDWCEWVEVLDRIDATSMPHREIAGYLRHELGVAPWWSQMVTGAYERIRGLREKNQRRDGGYEANKSKTYPVGVTTLFDGFRAQLRRRGVGDLKITVRKVTPLKSLRLTAGPGRPIAVHFWEKGEHKSQVQIQHQNLPTNEELGRIRELWTSFLAELGRHFDADLD